MRSLSPKWAFPLAWLGASAIVFPVLIAPFLLPEETILRLTPVCEWKAKYNRECPLCGMSRSFVHISRGEFKEACSLNRGGIPLYFGLAANEAAAAWFAWRLRMGAVSFAWGIVAFVGMILAFLPCLSPLNWFNLPFSALVAILGAAALLGPGTGKATALVGFVCSLIALGVSLARLALGAATL